MDREGVSRPMCCAYDHLDVCFCMGVFGTNLDDYRLAILVRIPGVLKENWMHLGDAREQLMMACLKTCSITHVRDVLGGDLIGDSPVLRIEMEST